MIDWYYALHTKNGVVTEIRNQVLEIVQPRAEDWRNLTVPSSERKTAKPRASSNIAQLTEGSKED